jgi:transcriptional regulator with XRE-family HTH domain
VARKPKIEGNPPRPSSLADKIDHLFRTVHSRDRGEYTFEEVADAINQRGAATISPTYIWQLRKGLRDNPTKKHLEALADFFGVNPTYFFDDEAAKRIDTELDLLATLRDSGVRQLALRAFGLSPETLDSITHMVERARDLEGLESAKPRRGRPPRPYR